MVLRFDDISTGQYKDSRLIKHLLRMRLRTIKLTKYLLALLSLTSTKRVRDNIFQAELVALKRLRKHHIELKREVFVEMKQVHILIRLK